MPTPRTNEQAVAYIVDYLWDIRGYDFRNYRLPFLTRRLRHVAERHSLQGEVVELAAAITEQPGIDNEIIESFTLGVTEMFRDPPFWRVLKNIVSALPHDQGILRCWVAGCATGEEAYSLAIMLRMLGFQQRYLIYATDINESSLMQARTCSLAGTNLEIARQNFALAGSEQPLDDYLQSSIPGDEIVSVCNQSIVFARHNLVTDATFNVFHLILCRNVLIYFNPILQRSVHNVLYDSLMPGGILGLGIRESLRQSTHIHDFQQVDCRARIFRRKI